MKNPPTVKSGDRVRVEIEGTVTYTAADPADFFIVDRGSTYVQSGSRYVSVWPTSDATVDVRVIHPPVAVGDVLITQEDYDRAPYGTVIFRDAGAPLVKRIDRWDCGCGSCDVEHRYILGGVPRTVIYVPEATS